MIGLDTNILVRYLTQDDQEQAKKAVKLINEKYETEISGGVNEKNIRNYAQCGADYISIGALTHSVKSIDMSLTAVR